MRALWNVGRHAKRSSLHAVSLGWRSVLRCKGVLGQPVSWCWPVSETNHFWVEQNTAQQPVTSQSDYVRVPSCPPACGVCVNFCQRDNEVYMLRISWCTYIRARICPHLHSGATEVTNMNTRTCADDRILPMHPSDTLLQPVHVHCHDDLFRFVSCFIV
jgi:hypothetical protein